MSEEEVVLNEAEDRIRKQRNLDSEMYEAGAKMGIAFVLDRMFANVTSINLGDLVLHYVKELDDIRNK